MKKYILIILILFVFIRCGDNPTPSVEQNFSSTYFDKICLERHVYYFYHGIGGYSYLAPKLNDNGTPVKCGESK